MAWRHWLTTYVLEKIVTPVLDEHEGKPPTQYLRPPLHVEATLSEHQERARRKGTATRQRKAQLQPDDMALIDAYCARHRDRKVTATEIAEHLVDERGKRRGDSRLAGKISKYLKK